jgi:cytochrome c biogenesis protein CcmG/thiol:disulfide interchange protein DsbE
LRLHPRIGFTALALALLLFGGCARRSHLIAEKDRKFAPEFNLKDADGKVVRLSDYRGKVVVLNFWATWCAPCRLEIPWFMEFEQQNKYRGFAVVGISMDEEGWSVVRPFLGELGVNYRTLMGDAITAAVYGGVDALPTTFLLDRSGRIAATHVGLVGKSNYAIEIEELLREPQARAAVDPGWGGAAAAAELAK